MTKVTVEDVARRLKNGEKLTIVDARAPQVWEESSTQAAGAIRIPPDNPEPYLNEVKPDAYAVIYCT